MTTSLSAKSTKAELFAGFEEMREKYEELKKQAPESAEKRRPMEDAIVQKTLAYTPTSLENEMSELRRHIQKSLDDLLVKLAEESKKLQDLRETIEIEAARLKEIRNIELTANALDAMLADYDQKKKELETEWQNRKIKLEEEIAARKKDWEREQEEYAYNLKNSRRKEEDGYEAECAKKETAWEEKSVKKQKELEEREAYIAERQSELDVLRKTAEDLPAKLEQSAREAEERVAGSLNKEFATEKRIAEQEWKSEKNILETRISAMSETISRQSGEITSLKEAVNIANQQAQTLASTVIESVSGTKQAKPVNADGAAKE